jgi:hypothetical protein
MVRLVAAGAGDWESRGASPSIVGAEAEDCTVIFVIARTSYALFGIFVLSNGLCWIGLEKEWRIGSRYEILVLNGEQNLPMG